MNLSSLTDLVGARGGATLRLEVATGGNLRLDNLQSITGSRNVRLTSDGTALNLPKLQTIDGAVLFELAVGQSLNLPQLTSFNGAGSA